ncbi:DNA-binding protein Roi, partial [Escherichia coli 07798]
AWSTVADQKAAR